MNIYDTYKSDTYKSLVILKVQGRMQTELFVSARFCVVNYVFLLAFPTGIAILNMFTGSHYI